MIRGRLTAIGAAIAGVIVVVLVIALLATRATLAEARQDLAAEQAAHAQTEANYRAASAQARAEAAAHARRIGEQQQQLSEEISRDYQTQLAALRDRADALRVQLAGAAADRGRSGAGGAPPLPGAAGGSDGAAAQAGLPAGTEPDAFALEDRLIATEQALQLDALQRWVRAQQAIDFNPR